MKLYEQLFLEALKASLQGEKVQWNTEILREDWVSLIELAGIHHVMPLIYDAVYDCEAAKMADKQMMSMFKRKILYQVMQQTVKTAEFIRIQRYLRDAGFSPIVVKGIVCRSLYPSPDYRISADEDILISEKEFIDCHHKMLEYGMHQMKESQDPKTDNEVSYRKKDSPVYIEMHNTLFKHDSEVYGEWNRYFADAIEQKIEVDVEGDTVLTMKPTQHLFYLICHSFKHFLHSGFGIRQVCDITMFANAYGKSIDWEQLFQWCSEINGGLFTAALFKIGEKYFTFDYVKACYPKLWRDIDVDETAMLEELLSSGVYGQANMSRKHSSNITLNAVASSKKGEKASGNILRVVFPEAKKLEHRYTYLKKYPYLLPAAWLDRLLKYKKEVSQTDQNEAAESIRIGNQRIELMKQYGIISEQFKD